jgi:hypothetical protein
MHCIYQWVCIFQETEDEKIFLLASFWMQVILFLNLSPQGRYSSGRLVAERRTHLPEECVSWWMYCERALPVNLSPVHWMGRSCIRDRSGGEHQYTYTMICTQEQYIINNNELEKQLIYRHKSWTTLAEQVNNNLSVFLLSNVLTHKSWTTLAEQIIIISLAFFTNVFTHNLTAPVTSVTQHETP